MTPSEHESPEAKQSRLLLIEVLELTDRLLERIVNQLIFKSQRVLRRVIENIRILMKAAQAAGKSLVESLKIGLNRRVRRSLERVGMFGAKLKAKFNLLSFDIQEGAVKRVLKRLNSILGSLAKVFEPLHIVKEFK